MPLPVSVTSKDCESSDLKVRVGRFEGVGANPAPFAHLAAGTTPCGRALAQGIAEVYRDAVFAQ